MLLNSGGRTGSTASPPSVAKTTTTEFSPHTSVSIAALAAIETSSTRWIPGENARTAATTSSRL